MRFIARGVFAAGLSLGVAGVSAESDYAFDSDVLKKQGIEVLYDKNDCIVLYQKDTNDSIRSEWFRSFVYGLRAQRHIVRTQSEQFGTYAAVHRPVSIPKEVDKAFKEGLRKQEGVLIVANENCIAAFQSIDAYKRYGSLEDTIGKRYSSQLTRTDSKNQTVFYFGSQRRP